MKNLKLLSASILFSCGLIFAQDDQPKNFAGLIYYVKNNLSDPDNIVGYLQILGEELSELNTLHDSDSYYHARAAKLNQAISTINEHRTQLCKMYATASTFKVKPQQEISENCSNETKALLLKLVTTSLTKDEKLTASEEEALANKQHEKCLNSLTHLMILQQKDAANLHNLKVFVVIEATLENLSKQASK